MLLFLEDIKVITKLHSKYRGEVFSKTFKTYFRLLIDLCYLLVFEGRWMVES